MTDDEMTREVFESELGSMGLTPTTERYSLDIDGPYKTGYWWKAKTGECVRVPNTGNKMVSRYVLKQIKVNLDWALLS